MACITIACFYRSLLTAEEKVVPIGSATEGNKFYLRWYGLAGQGIVEKVGFPDLWSKTKNVLWAMELSGTGYSSPITWVDRTFLTTAYVRRNVTVDFLFASH